MVQADVPKLLYNILNLKTKLTYEPIKQARKSSEDTQVSVYARFGKGWAG